MKRIEPIRLLKTDFLLRTMEITIKKEAESKSEAIVLGLFWEDRPLFANKNLTLEVEEATKKKIFAKEKFGQSYLTSAEGKRVLIIALGKRKELDANKVRRIFGKVVKIMKANRLTSFFTNVTELVRPLFSAQELGRYVSEGLILGNYNFIKYLSKEKQEENKPIANVYLQWKGEEKALLEGIRMGRAVADATNYVKDLVNEPANVVTPIYLEQEAKKLSGVKVRVLNKEELKKEGLHAFLGVNLGSHLPPKLIFIEYKGAGNAPWTAIVGKGITFDSGGLNLKPTGYMEDMKCDMSGAGAVLGTIKVLSQLGIKKNVLGVIPATENAIGGMAQKPGDIVRAYNGKTIEIGNTDAEGRLILADALSYTEAKYNPEIMIDLATLTGACVVALGYEASGIMGKDESLLADLEKAGRKSYDRVWRFPFYEEYQDHMDGLISDVNNISFRNKGRDAGAIMGGVFLSKFVDKAKWAHIDIAGPAFLVEDSDYQQKFGSGCGVRLLSYYFIEW